MIDPFFEKIFLANFAVFEKHVFKEERHMIQKLSHFYVHVVVVTIW